MKNTILKASAGSGKTYRLSNEYLNILFEASPEEMPLEKILASTFTRKAAGEISDSVFEKFAKLVLNPKEREYLKQYITYLQSDPTEELLQDRLAEMAKNMYRMRISTLHSYFSKIASVYSFEMNLPPGWSVIEEKSEEFKLLLHEAVGEILESDDREYVVQLLSRIQGDKISSQIASDLVKLAENNLKFVEETEQEAWEHDLFALILEIIPKNSSVENLCDQLTEFPHDKLPQTGTGKNKHVQVAFEKACKNLPVFARNDEWGEFFADGVMKKMIPYLKEPSMECKYGKVSLMERCPEFFHLARELALHGVLKEFEIIAEQNRGYRKLLKLLSVKLGEILQRERKFRYDDISWRVASFAESGKLQSLHHRLNAETKHLLLDEFQDTSISQWKILESVAQRVVKDEAGVFFCVGDPKQAIYTWRGGVAEIFQTIQQKLGNDLFDEPESMKESRRSCQAVIDTVNFLFENIKDNTIVETLSPNAGKAWQDRFELHAVCEGLQGLPGFCTLEQAKDEKQAQSKRNSDVEDDEESQPSATFLDYVVKRIAEMNEILLKRPDLKKGLGVLVWTNEMGRKIVEKLKNEYGIEVNGNGNQLEKSLAVRYVLSAMKLADHPGDTASLFHLAHGPLAKILVERTSDKEISDDNTNSTRKDWLYSASSSSRKIRRNLLSKGYGETIKTYVEILAPSCDAQEFQYLETLLELAYRFDEQATGIRTKKFISLVKETNLSNPNAAKVQVMTIFGAKGLEFDIVVLPELNLGLEGQYQPKFIIGHKTPEDQTTQISLVLKKPKQELMPLLPEMYNQAWEMQVKTKVEESLSQLYVAMTRAKRQLVMIIPEQPKPKDSKAKSNEPKTSFAETLRKGLAGKGDPTTSETILYQHGKVDWYEESISSDQAVAVPVEVETLRCKVSGKKSLHHVPRIKPSAPREGISETKSSRKAKETPAWWPTLLDGTKLKRTEETAMLWGNCIHACFENAVEWLDPIKDDEPKLLCSDELLHEILEEILRFHEPGFAAADVIFNFHANRKNPQVVTALSRTRYSERNLEVECERPFIVWCNGQIMRGIIDRLVIRRDESGKVAGLEIIDYKSDTGDIDSLEKKYQTQLDDYRTAMSVLYGIDASQIETRLVFVTQGEVRPVFTLTK